VRRGASKTDSETLSLKKWPSVHERHARQLANATIVEEEVVVANLRGIDA
jgi:hypothetical protein